VVVVLLKRRSVKAVDVVKSASASLDRRQRVASVWTASVVLCLNVAMSTVSVETTVNVLLETASVNTLILYY